MTLDWNWLILFLYFLYFNSRGVNVYCLLCANLRKGRRSARWSIIDTQSIRKVVGCSVFSSDIHPRMSLQILKKFKWIDNFYSPLKSSENLLFSDNFRRNRSYLNWLNIWREVRRRSFIMRICEIIFRKRKKYFAEK